MQPDPGNESAPVGAASQLVCATKVVAVVVSFFPDLAVLVQGLKAILAQVEVTVVVDNGSPAELEGQLGAQLSQGIKWVALGSNTGVARAQNVGIALAIDLGASHVILFDQDSAPAPGAVAHLVRAASDLEKRGIQVGQVASVVADERHKAGVPFFRLRAGRPDWVQCRDGDSVMEIDTAIASGSLMPTATLTAIGGMKEELFIDLVDIEWCFRARSRGFRNYCACGARLEHRLGDMPERLLNRDIVCHSPSRNYYFFRNALWLFRQDYVPNAWKRDVALQLMKRYVVYSLALRPRLEYLGMMTKGIWHGLRRRLGPL